MRSDSEAGSDTGAEMVGGDMSDGEKSVKDTSKKKKPEWDAKKQRHKTWLWRYLGYADATGGGPTARGKDRWKLSSSDPQKVAAYRKRNAAVFVDVYEAIKDTTAAGVALRMQIETEFAEDRDGYGLLMLTRCTEHRSYLHLREEWPPTGTPRPREMEHQLHSHT